MGLFRALDKIFSLDMPLNHNCDYEGHIWGDWKHEGDKQYRECRWCGFRKYYKG